MYVTNVLYKLMNHMKFRYKIAYEFISEHELCSHKECLLSILL
jgi:hypothetical protein